VPDDSEAFARHDRLNAIRREHDMYEHSFGTHRDPNVRASDADREATGERLRRHHAEGRLDSEEFQERIDRCYEAKTVGELDQLVTDLPRDGAEGGGRRRYLRLFPIPLVPILVVILVVSIAGWHHGAFGLLWLIPLFFLIRFCLWRRFGWWGRPRRYWDEPQV
jgi:hypothetical protein